MKIQGKLTPGMSLGITVEFSTNEYNTFEDFIKIHCEVIITKKLFNFDLTTFLLTLKFFRVDII